MKKLARLFGTVAAGGLLPVVCFWLAKPMRIWDLSYEFGIAWLFLSVGLGVIFFNVANGASKEACLKSIWMTGAFIVGALLIYPLGRLFNVLEWPVFNTWALSHASFVVALPLLIFVVIKLIKQLFRQ